MNDINKLVQLKKTKDFEISVHFPKPVIIEKDFNMDLWKFASRKEYYYESEINFEVFKELSETFIHMVSILGEKYGFTPVLELDAINRYIYMKKNF